MDVKDFWQRLRTGVEVAVYGPTPDRLLGVRDGFQRYFRERLERPVPIAVVPRPGDPAAAGLRLSDEEVIRAVREQAREVEAEVGEHYHFYVASEGGIDSLRLDDGVRHVVRNWTCVRSSFGEALGASGAVELPARLIQGLDADQLPFAVPGTRKSGGMISSLTGGLENRRQAVALATLHALSSLFYGILGSGGGDPGAPPPLARR